MSIEFKSQATGPLLMLNETAKQIFKIIGKEPTPQGIITVAQMDGILERLHEAIEQDSQRTSKLEQIEKMIDNDKDEFDPGLREEIKNLVSLKQRVWPFMEMIQLSKEAGKDIVWGV